MTEWPAARRYAVSAWAGLVSIYLIFAGIPFDRANQLILILTAALAFSVGTDHGPLRIFADWIPFFILLYAYDFSRGAADQFGRPVLVEEIYNVELSWFGINGQIPTVWFQQHLYQAEKIPLWESDRKSTRLNSSH